MTRASPELTERNQHEAPFRHARMGNSHLHRAERHIFIKQNVNIDDARAITPARPPAELTLDRLAPPQQLERHQTSDDLGDAIQEPRLGRVADRLRPIERRNPQHLDSGRSQAGERPFDVALAIAEI
jgi:hypothetical protein